MNTKLEATRAAKKCLRLMRTKGWKIYINNIGWHWCLEHAAGHFTLRQSERAGEYWTLMSDGEHAHTGCMMWTDRSRMFKDPNAAVAHQLNLAKQHILRIASWVNKVDRTINDK